MEKILIVLFLIAGFVGSFTDAMADANVVDTLIADGYYRLRVRQWTGSNTKIDKGVDSTLCVQQWPSSSNATFNAMGLYGLLAKPSSLVIEDDIDCIWHITSAGDGTYHFKNCGNQNETYIQPFTETAGQCDFIHLVGKETTRFYIRKKDYGSKTSGGRNSVMDRVDEAPAGRVFIVPNTSTWRMRLGGSNIVKLNSKDLTGLHAWILDPVDLRGKEAWMQLNEEITEIAGAKYSYGKNPGQITSITALDALENTLEEARDLWELGGSDEDYREMLNKLRSAKDEAIKYEVKIDEGYFLVCNHYGYRDANYIRYIAPFYDPNRVHKSLHSEEINEYWLGAQKSNMLDPETCDPKYVWHFMKKADGTVLWKNCGESKDINDQSYLSSMCETNSLAQGDGYGLFEMKGTPQTGTIYTQVSANNYVFWTESNYFKWNVNTNVNMVAALSQQTVTCGSWDLYTVPASRITPKWTLNEAITDAGGISKDWSVGLNPGQLNPNVIDALREELDNAREVYANASSTDEQYAAAEKKLREVYAATMEMLKDTDKVQNPIEDGYYRIVGGFTATAENAKSGPIRYFFHATDDSYFKWGTDDGTDNENPYKVFKITKCPSGNHIVQNLATLQYVGANTINLAIPMTDSITTEQIFTLNSKEIYVNGAYKYRMNKYRTRGWWTVGSLLTPNTYWHMTSNNIGHAYNSLTNGHVTLEKVTDSLLIQRLLSEATFKKYAAELKGVLNEADAALDKTVTYDFNEAEGLIKETGGSPYDPANCQVTSNNHHWGYGSYANLIDGKMETYFLGRVHTNGGGPLPTEDTYLQVDMKEPQTAIRFMYGICGNYTALYGNIGGRPCTYGAGDLGHDRRPLDFTVKVANDTLPGTEWKEVKVINNVPTDQNIRRYWSPAIVLDKPYQFVRVSVHKNLANTICNYIAVIFPGEFQVYPATYNPENSPIEYNESVKKAAEILKPIVQEARKQYEDKNISEGMIEKLRQATNNLNAVNVDTMEFASQIYAARILNDSSYVYDDEAEAKYGDVSAADKAKFEDAIAAAELAMNPDSKPTPESIKTASEALAAACVEHEKNRKNFELNKWYFITSEEKQGYHVSSNPSWRGNHAVYACGNNAQEPMKEGVSAPLVEPIRYGHYTGFNGMPDGLTIPKDLGASTDYNDGYLDCEDYPYAMWRIVPIEGKEGRYAIQNRGTGFYMGRRQDQPATGTYNGITQSEEPMECVINRVGRNQYEILCVDERNAYYSSPANAKNSVKTIETDVPLHSQGADFHMVWWGTGTERGYDTGSAYTFKPVEEPDAEVNYPFIDNTINIVTLPISTDFSGGVLYTGVSEAKTYGIHSITTTGENSTVQLVEKTQFAAGEPFVLVNGDPKLYDEKAKDSIQIYISPNDDFTQTPLISNGLVGVLNGKTVDLNNKGFFVESVLQVGNAEKFVKGHEGYIDPALVKTQSGTPDLIVTANGILDAVRTVIADKKNEMVDVYSVDGTLIKRKVKASVATKGLSKGVYVIDKQKVLIP